MNEDRPRNEFEWSERRESMPPSLWTYAPVACETCGGACCSHIALLFSDMTEDRKTWLAAHGVIIDGNEAVFPMPCRWLRDGRCSIYDARPNICRDFQVGGPFCLVARARNKSLKNLSLV